MMRRMRLTHEFVEYVPEDPAEGTIYVSLPFATAIHKCCCGCGNEVVTPLSPTDWTLIFDGESVSLYPSIGNWSFPCRSHYWIRCSEAVWAPRWSRRKIRAAQARDRLVKERYFGHIQPATGTKPKAKAKATRKGKLCGSVWTKIKQSFF